MKHLFLFEYSKEADRFEDLCRKRSEQISIRSRADISDPELSPAYTVTIETSIIFKQWLCSVLNDQGVFYICRSVD